MTDLTANEDLDALSAELLAKVADAGDEAALEQLRVETLGKKGVITLRMASLGQVDPAARGRAGQ
jgi:phenylalanyl-tRNA synthetase alpha chain